MSFSNNNNDNNIKEFAYLGFKVSTESAETRDVLSWYLENEETRWCLVCSGPLKIQSQSRKIKYQIFSRNILVPYSDWCISWRSRSPSKQSASVGFTPIRSRSCFTLSWLEPPSTKCLASRWIFPRDKIIPWNSSLNSQPKFHMN